MKAYVKWRLGNAEYAYIIDETGTQPFIYNSQTSGRTYYDGSTATKSVSEKKIQTIVNGISYYQYETYFNKMAEMINTATDGTIHLMDASAYYDLSDDVCSTDSSSSSGSGSGSESDDSCCVTAEDMSVTRKEFADWLDTDTIPAGTSWEDIFKTLFKAMPGTPQVPTISLTTSPSNETFVKVGDENGVEIIGEQRTSSNGWVYIGETKNPQPDSIWTTNYKTQIAYGSTTLSSTTTSITTEYKFETGGEMLFTITASRKYNASETAKDSTGADASSKYSFPAGTATASANITVYGVYPIYVNFDGNINGTKYMCKNYNSSAYETETKYEFLYKKSNTCEIEIPDVLGSTGFMFSVPSKWTIDTNGGIKITTDMGKSNATVENFTVLDGTENRCNTTYNRYKMKDNAKGGTSSILTITFNQYNNTNS